MVNQIKDDIVITNATEETTSWLRKIWFTYKGKEIYVLLTWDYSDGYYAYGRTRQDEDTFQELQSLVKSLDPYADFEAILDELTYKIAEKK